MLQNKHSLYTEGLIHKAVKLEKKMAVKPV